MTEMPTFHKEHRNVIGSYGVCHCLLSNWEIIVIMGVRCLCLKLQVFLMWQNKVLINQGYGYVCLCSNSLSLLSDLKTAEEEQKIPQCILMYKPCS